MSQRGFTLLEVLLTLVVGGLVVGASMQTVLTLSRGSNRMNGQSVALADIDTVAHWITRDISQAATTTDLVDGAPPVSQVTLSWADMTAWAPASSTHTLTYCFNLLATTTPCDAQATNVMKRDYDGLVTSVGRHLTDVGFSLSGRVVTITVTSSPDDFTPRSTRTRTYQISLRPGEAF